MKKLFTLLIIFIAVGMASAQTSPAPLINNAPPAPEKDGRAAFSLADLVGLKGQRAPQFSLLSMNGDVSDLENLRGRIVVVNLWGTFCAPCITEMPELNALVKKFQDKNVVFLAPAPDDKKKLEVFLQKHIFDYQVLPNGLGVVAKYAPRRKSGDSPNKGGFMMTLPTHLVIDQTGTVVYHNWGYKKTITAELSKEIDSLLNRQLSKSE